MSASHNHDHSHDTDTYYLDQLCMIGITAAFAGICLTLYYFNTPMLGLLLQDQFHIYIAIVGFALLFVVLVRATVLWKAAGASEGAHAHHHGCCHDEHEHHEHAEHEHHEHAGHDHHEGCGHDHATATATALPMAAPDHHHDHDHDHGWAPWRYVVLLVPLMLFLLGLPSRAVPLTPGDVVDVSNEAAQLAQIVAAGTTPFAQAELAGAMLLQGEEGFDLDSPVPIDFKQLEQLAFEDSLRKSWNQKKVQVSGQFVPYPGTDRVFNLSRLRIQCCGADAVQLNIPVVCRESLKGFNREDWVRVTGRIEFREQPGRPGIFKTVLVVGRRANVMGTDADPRPYIN
jgi:hypothetical protein